MRRVRNIAGLDECEVRGLEHYLEAEPDTAWVTNVRKSQYVNLTEMGGRPMVVKSYFHNTWRHRFVSWLGMANADRYVKACRILAEAGVRVPACALVLKRGRSLLPEGTLLVMEKLPGDMLVRHLAEIEADPGRLHVLASSVAKVIISLRGAMVTHRDLNAKNFLITADNRVSLIDFDFATCHLFRSWVFHRRHKRDVVTFLNHCGVDGPFATEVRRLLDDHGFSPRP